MITMVRTSIRDIEAMLSRLGNAVSDTDMSVKELKKLSMDQIAIKDDSKISALGATLTTASTDLNTAKNALKGSISNLLNKIYSQLDMGTLYSNLHKPTRANQGPKMRANADVFLKVVTEIETAQDDLKVSIDNLRVEVAKYQGEMNVATRHSNSVTSSSAKALAEALDNLQSDDIMRLLERVTMDSMQINSADMAYTNRELKFILETMKDPSDNLVPETYDAKIRIHYAIFGALTEYIEMFVECVMFMYTAGLMDEAKAQNFLTYVQQRIELMSNFTRNFVDLEEANRLVLQDISDRKYDNSSVEAALSDTQTRVIELRGALETISSGTSMAPPEVKPPKAGKTLDGVRIKLTGRIAQALPYGSYVTAGKPVSYRWEVNGAWVEDTDTLDLTTVAVLAKRGKQNIVVVYATDDKGNEVSETMKYVSP